MCYLADRGSFNRLKDLAESFRGWGEISRGLEVNNDRRYFDWLEFCVEGFYGYLNELVSLSNDQVFYFYDLASTPIEEFYRFFKKYPVVMLRRGINEEDYFSALNKEPGKRIIGRTDRVALTSTYAIFPESMNWYIYGDYDIELARLVSKVGLPPDSLFPHDFLTEEEARERIKLLDSSSTKPS